MTRRIIRSFSDTPDDMTPAREQWSANGSYAAQTDIRAAQSRRETENMLADVARSESQSNDVYRRIEEQLRNVARRLETAERNQSENNRAMSQAASEINIAAREQAQAFDQLGGSVMGLADRLDRVERSTATDGTRDAIKGLHQGLSRLAEQISSTANQSATQISSLAGNLETIAGRVSQTRSEGEASTRALEQQIAQLDQRLSHVAAIDERLRAVERTAHTNGEALSTALHAIEQRKDDEAAALRRDAETASAIARLEDNVSRLETRGPDPAIDRRLQGIERTLSDIVGRFDSKPDDAIEDNLKRLAQRIEAAETRQREQIAELKAQFSAPRPAEMLAQPPLSQPQPMGQPPLAPPPDSPFAPAFEAPPFAEAPGQHAPFQVSADPFAPAFDSGNAFPTDSPFGEDIFAAAPPPPPAEPDNYLSAARRSARAAAAQAEAERGSRIGGFSWGAAAEAAPAEKPSSRKTYIWIGIIALMSIVAIAAGAVLSQKLSSDSPHTVSVLFPKPNGAPKPPAVLPPSDTPPADKPAMATTEVKPAPVHSVPEKPAAAAATVTPVATPPAKPAATPLDKLTQLANAGNGKAELIVGLKYLDGDGVPVNEADAAKWLERAAEQGMAVAQYRLGTLYERGRGVPADASKAVKWYTLAAQAGNRKAMHNLAVAYASGAGVQKNLSEAARWFSKAASLGLSDSQFNLAVLYERGMGVPQSLIDAYKWYAIAAAGGDSESKARIDALATQISPDDKSAAQRAADAFKPQAIDPRANVAPQMGDVVN
ncbi:MAG: SEL1-like repeat protein [Proteobacteria bacterium]|nr:SEL1-like repeat protein [Pseudomonadota bacterium]